MVIVFQVLPPNVRVLFPGDETFAVIATIDELALKVRPVTVPKSIIVDPPVAVNVHVPLPRLSVRVPVPAPLRPVDALSVTLLLFVANVSVPV